MDVDDDCFDRLPDPIVLIIFNRISDVKTLILCRSVSKRFNSLVPQTEWLCLRVDRVISSTSSDDDENSDDAPFFNFFNSIVDSIQNLFNLGGPDDGDGFQSFCFAGDDTLRVRPDPSAGNRASRRRPGAGERGGGELESRVRENDEKLRDHGFPIWWEPCYNPGFGCGYDAGAEDGGGLDGDCSDGGDGEA
ncbi:F-box protein AUF1 [Linum perenne]